MDDSNKNREEVVTKFERIHDHLDVVDQTLDEISREIRSDIADSISETDVEVSYDIDTGEIYAELPISRVTARINRRLESPFFVKHEDGKIVVADVRREFDAVNHEDIKAVDGVRNLKSLVVQLEDSYENGAPMEAVVELSQYIGLDTDKAEHEIEKLKQKGEVYEPVHGHLRTT